MDKHPDTEFYQERPRLGNQFLEDSALQSYLPRFLSSSDLAQATPELTQLGDRTVEDLLQNNHRASLLSPVLEKQDVFGAEINVIHTHEPWKFNHNFSAESGMIATAYEDSPVEAKRVF
jgi:hypothetical protein